MLEHSDNHHILFHKLLHSKMGPLYLFLSFLNFVKSLVGLFIPVYIYGLTQNFTLIFIWTILLSLTYVLIIPSAVKILNKVGFKRMILYSLIQYFLILISLNFIETSTYFIYLNAILIGIYASLFWPAMHTEIAFNTNKKNAENDLSNLQILGILSGSLAPVISGFFLEKFSYLELLILSLILLTIGSYFLFKSKEIKLKKIDFSFSKYFQLKKKYKKSPEGIVFKIEGIETFFGGFLFPVFLFIFLESNFLDFGILVSIISFCLAILIFFSKNKLNKFSKNKLNKRISKLLASSWILRSLFMIFSFPFLTFYEFLHKSIDSFFRIAFFSIFYENCKKENYLDYILFREFELHITRIIFVAILIAVMYFIPSFNLVHLLVSTIILSFILGFLKER